MTELLLHCITPLHVGVGQEVGVVDLPVARERPTAFPTVPGSGLRGALRERAEGREGKGGPEWEGLADRLFGSDEDDAPASCVSVLDARVLLFPVRSTRGVFQWVTCAFVLDRYRRDREYFLGEAAGGDPGQLQVGEGRYMGPGTGELDLEEFPFVHQGPWSWDGNVRDIDASRVVVVDDVSFRYFVENATLVRQRNRLTTAKTVAEGALFSVEAVPPETVFYTFLGARAERRPEGGMGAEEVRRRLREVVCESAEGTEGHLVLGGDEGVGFGLTRAFWRG